MQKQNSLLSKKRSKDKPLRKKSSKNIKIKGPWTPHEDQLLMKWIQNHGPKNWARCAETIKGRNGKQCREHWNNSLNYNIVKGQWSTEEDLFIMVFYDKLDKSWKKMIPLFKSRTENAIKNRFFSQLRKITAKFVKKDKNEYNSKFKLGILIKYYDKGVEEAKNDFLKEHPMTEDNYKSFIKDIENLINNKPKEQKYIDLENVEKKYFLNSNHAVINNVNNNNEKKEEDKNNENENNLNNNNEEENKDNINNMENYIPKVDFEVVLTRFERIWKPIISRGVVNSMLGIYVFEYDTISWKKKCINFNTVEFMPQNEVSVKFSLRDVNPKGFIIMPVTYGEGIKGPFLIMAKCKTRFNFTQLDDNFE